MVDSINDLAEVEPFNQNVRTPSGNETACESPHQNSESELDQDNNSVIVDDFNSFDSRDIRDYDRFSENGSLYDSEEGSSEHLAFNDDNIKDILNPIPEKDADTELRQFLAGWIDRFNIPGSASNALFKGLKLLENQNVTFDNLPLDVQYV